MLAVRPLEADDRAFGPVIRPLEADDRASWEPLWTGYLDFYGEPAADRRVDDTWARLLDPAADIHGLAAVDDGAMLGITHYLFHADTWQPAGRCYLNDLFTAPEARGRGVGEALVEAVAEAARARGCPKLYWLTQEHNATARRLYDRVAQVTPFIRYVKTP